MSVTLDDVQGVRPLNARSLVLSVLLGLDPPALTARSLVSLAGLFGVAAGTMRTAISRMVAAGELTAADGEYRLVGRLLDRKAAQDIGRRPPPARWDGSWWVAAVTVPRRSVAERRAFRTEMTNRRMGELRPDTWMRPANLDAMPVSSASGVAAVRGPLDGVAATDLVSQLWPLDDLARQAATLGELIADAEPDLDSGDPLALTRTIALSAAAVRFLRAEPLLPPALVPPGWPVDRLRADYRSFDRAFGRVLTSTVRASE